MELLNCKKQGLQLKDATNVWGFPVACSIAIQLTADLEKVKFLIAQ